MVTESLRMRVIQNFEHDRHRSKNIRIKSPLESITFVYALHTL